jgi:hypothetical protein
MTGSPPAASRFRKGLSGNPKGRPRKPAARSASAFDIVIDRTLTVMQDGRARELTIDEALQHKTYLEAIAGSRAARRQILKMIAVREKAMTKSAPQTASVSVLTEAHDPRNVDDALLILGIATQDRSCDDEPTYDPTALLLETWAVQAALARRTARRLGKQDIETGRYCTRDASGLQWPTPEGR